MTQFDSTAIELTKKRLFTPAQKEKIKRRSLLQAGLVEHEPNTTDPADRNLRTILRIRARIDKENPASLIEVESDNEVIFRPEGRNRADKYSFSKVLTDEASQNEVFNETCKNLLEATMSDRNCCLFTYGASGSGKTYTIMGGAGESAGLLPRSLESIFSTLGEHLYAKQDIRPSGSAYIGRVGISDERKWAKIKDELMQQDLDGDQHYSGDWANKSKRRSSLLNASLREFQDNAPTPVVLSELVHDTDYILFGSFIEIYNEKIYDLLVPLGARKRSRDELRIRQDAKGPFVGGVREIQINSANEAYRLLAAGRQNQMVAQTRLNHESSRSHCIFQLKIVRRLTRDRWSVTSLAFCDLAGAERSKKVGTDRTRLAESKTINKSLLQLGVVIEDLRRNQSKPGTVAVSFRNSKLTRLMQSYLTGNAKTTIIVAVSQDPQLTEETQNSLKFAATAQTVQTMGTDRQGRMTLMESTRSNITRLGANDKDSVCFKTMTSTMFDAHSSTFKQPASSTSSTTSSGQFSSLENRNPSAQNWDENYAKWKKVDLIEDLVYFRDRDRENQTLILQMKNAWKEDEQEKEYYQKETVRLNNEFKQTERQIRNEHEIEITDLCRQIRAAKTNTGNGVNQNEYKQLQVTYKSVVEENVTLDRELRRLKEIESDIHHKLDLLSAKYEAKENEAEELKLRNQMLRDEKEKFYQQKQQKENIILDLEEEMKHLKVNPVCTTFNDDATLNFSMIGPPKLGSSMMVTEKSSPVKMNSTQKLDSKMCTTLDLLEASSTQGLKTPDLSIVRNDDDGDGDNEMIKLYSQIQSLQIDLRNQRELNEKLTTQNGELDQQLRDQLVDLDRLSKASSSIEKSKSNSKLDIHIQEAAKREADLEDRINALEIENQLLQKQSDRSLLRKKNDQLRTTNAELLERISSLEDHQFIKSAPTTVQCKIEAIRQMLAPYSAKQIRQRSPDNHLSSTTSSTGRQLRSRIVN